MEMLRVRGGVVEEVRPRHLASTAPDMDPKHASVFCISTQKIWVAPGTPRIELKLFLNETSLHRGRPRYGVTSSILN